MMNAMRGELKYPRGLTTREQLGTSIRLTNSLNNILVSEVRGLNYRFMVAEWLWMLYGLRELKPVARYNSKIAETSDDGVTLAGAYGPHIAAQSVYVIRKLSEDNDTRQAVMTIWQPNPKPSKDIPCTVAAQFIRSGAYLNAIFTMRSSDTWLGLPYDLFNFSMILNYFAGCLSWEPGFLQVNLGSSHVYEKDWEKAMEFIGSSSYLASPKLSGDPPPMLRDILLEKDTFDDPFLEEPWIRYGKALVCNRSWLALEELRG